MPASGAALSAPTIREPIKTVATIPRLTFRNQHPDFLSFALNRHPPLFITGHGRGDPAPREREPVPGLRGARGRGLGVGALVVAAQPLPPGDPAPSQGRLWAPQPKAASPLAHGPGVRKPSRRRCIPSGGWAPFSLSAASSKQGHRKGGAGAGGGDALLIALADWP